MDLFEQIDFQSPQFCPHREADKIVRAIAGELPEYYSGHPDVLTQQGLREALVLMLIYKQEIQQNEQ